MTTLNRLLNANRGEIAVRIARSARRLGIATIAVCSDADRGSPHVAACDEHVPIGGLWPSESYLVIDKILAAARATGAQAIHPGYGFLSEGTSASPPLTGRGSHCTLQCHQLSSGYAARIGTDKGAKKVETSTSFG